MYETSLWIILSNQVIISGKGHGSLVSKMYIFVALSTTSRVPFSSIKEGRHLMAGIFKTHTKTNSTTGETKNTYFGFWEELSLHSWQSWQVYLLRLAWKMNLLKRTCCCKLNLILSSSDNIFLVNSVMRGTLVIGLHALLVHSSVIGVKDPLESPTLTTHLLEKDREALQPLLLLTVTE